MTDQRSIDVERAGPVKHAARADGEFRQPTSLTTTPSKFAVGEVIEIGVTRHGETVTLPLPLTTDACRIQLSFFSLGIIHDSTYTDNFFSGAETTATPLPDRTGWSIKAQAYFGWGGPQGDWMLRDIAVNYLVVQIK